MTTYLEVVPRCIYVRDTSEVSGYSIHWSFKWKVSLHYLPLSMRSESLEYNYGWHHRELTISHL